MVDPYTKKNFLFIKKSVSLINMYKFFKIHIFCSKVDTKLKYILIFTSFLYSLPKYSLNTYFNTVHKLINVLMKLIRNIFKLSQH